MTSPMTILEIVQASCENQSNDRDKAIALHDYVRDKVKFGFNKYFDATPPEYTISCGYGHCNPKSRLMVALFKAAGFECFQHFVVIPKDILAGAVAWTRFWMIPSELCHSYTEVRVSDHWYSIDSYMIDTPLMIGAKRRLSSESREVGYGARRDSVNSWDGQSDAFSQFDQKAVIEDHGRVEDLDAYFKSKRYRHHFLGMPFNTMFLMMGEFGVAPMNKHIDKIRGNGRSE